MAYRQKQQIYNVATKNPFLALSWQLNSVLLRKEHYLGLIKEFSKKNTLSLQQPTISYLHLQPCGQLSTHMIL